MFSPAQPRFFLVSLNLIAVSFKAIKEIMHHLCFRNSGEFVNFAFVASDRVTNSSFRHDFSFELEKARNGYYCYLEKNNVTKGTVYVSIQHKLELSPTLVFELILSSKYKCGIHVTE